MRVIGHKTQDARHKTQDSGDWIADERESPSSWVLSLPLYISGFGGRNVNLDSPTASFIIASRHFAEIFPLYMIIEKPYT
jgi:hypothetical protein